MRKALPFLPLGLFLILAIEAHRRLVLPGDVRFAGWVQSWSIPGYDRFCSLSNWLFATIPIIAVTIVVYLWCVFRRDNQAAIIVLGAMVLHFLNSLFKALVESDRPTAGLVRVDEPTSGLGFPSGHTSGAVLLLGMIAWLATRRMTNRRHKAVIWTVASLLVLQTGLGRIRVGAHWPTDVLGALLWSIPVLVVWISISEQVLTARVKKRDSQE